MAAEIRNITMQLVDTEHGQELIPLSFSFFGNQTYFVPLPGDRQQCNTVYENIANNLASSEPILHVMVPTTPEIICDSERIDTIANEMSCTVLPAYLKQKHNGEYLRFIFPITGNFKAQKHYTIIESI